MLCTRIVLFIDLFNDLRTVGIFFHGRNNEPRSSSVIQPGLDVLMSPVLHKSNSYYCVAHWDRRYDNVYRLQ